MRRKANSPDVKKLTAKAVAQRLGKSARTVRKWCDDGLFKNAELEETPIGPVWMIPESDLVNFQPPARGNPNLLAKKKSSIRKRVK